MTQLTLSEAMRSCGPRKKNGRNVSEVFCIIIYYFYCKKLNAFLQ